MTIPPLYWRWEGDAMVPLRPAIADKHFVVGMNYMLEPVEERSEASHRHYFASINQSWQSLPDELMAEYPTADHLRRKMLIKAGYADETSIVLNTKADAIKVAALAQALDGYAVIIVRDNVVRIYRAQTQSYKGMDKKTFGTSKTRVLELIADLLERKAA